MNFTLKLEPMATPRPRASVRHGRVRSYMPKKYTEWKKAAVAQLHQQHQGMEKIDQVVHIKIDFICKRPKSLMRKKDPAGLIPKGTLPDIDNLAKSVLDALQDAQIIQNDSLVASLTIAKYYAALKADRTQEDPIIIIIIKDIE